jgi:hypothetical protein
MDFNAARSKHLLWKSKTRKFLDEEDSMTEDQVVSHRHCDLGKWLYAIGLKRYGDVPGMQRLEQVHESLHELIGRVVQFKHAARDEKAEQEYTKFEPISREVVTLLNAIERKVNKESDLSVKSPFPKSKEYKGTERRSSMRPWTGKQYKRFSEPLVSKPKSIGAGDDSDWEEF